MMGRFMTAELSATGFFSNVDVIVPVPLHLRKWKMLKKHLYNVRETSPNKNVRFHLVYPPALLNIYSDSYQTLHCFAGASYI